jgi:methylamine---glutamate N-methyltransferase subunit B
MEAMSASEITYDARGLVEPDVTAPEEAIVDGNSAAFDATAMTSREINQELRRLLYGEGIVDVRVVNPRSRHSIATTILTRCRIRIEGSLGYFACGMLDGPEVEIDGRVGWSACQNMMSGVVVIRGNAGSLTAAALRGGDVVVHGRVGARTGIDQKGGTIIVTGSAGSMTGFMMQRGRQIICGDVGAGLGDSMYDGEIYVAGDVAALGVDCVEGEISAADREMLARKFEIHELGSPPDFRKFVCGKQLYNYDTLEPSERKLVL